MNANQKKIDDYFPKWRHEADENYFPCSHRLDAERIQGKPVWYAFLERSDTVGFDDDVKFVFWKNIIEEWRDGADYHRREQWESFIDRSQKNPDLPDVQAFEEMGLKLARKWREPWDEIRRDGHSIKNGSRRSMDQADFEDRCIVKNGRLYAMYMKSSADMKGPWHLRPETIQERLNRDEKRPICSWDDALTLSTAWTKLGFDPATVNRTIYGYTAFDGTRKPGLKKARTTHAAYFEKLTLELPVLFDDETGQHEIPQGEADEIRRMRDEKAQWVYEDPEWDFEIQPDEDGYGVMAPVGQYDENHFNWIKGKVWYEDEEDLNSAHDEFGPAQDAVFSAHPLHWGNEALTHEFLTSIRTAKTIKELDQVERRLRRRYNKYTGRWSKPELHYLTPSQKAQAWLYCNTRREELMEAAVHELGKEALETLKHIRECKDGDDYDMVRARVLSHINGRTYKYAWQEIRFQRPRVIEAAYLRYALNKKERELFH